MTKRMPISLGFQYVAGRSEEPEEPLNSSDLFSILQAHDPCEANPADAAADLHIGKLDQQYMRRAFGALPAPFYQVITSRHVDLMSFPEIEAAFPTLQGRVRRIHAKGMRLFLQYFAAQQQEHTDRIVGLPRLGM